MILWSEQKPDFTRKPIEGLLGKLAFTAVCAVLVGGSGRPRVVIFRGIRHQLREHLSEQMIEMGGLLIGSVHTVDDTDTGFVVTVEDIARADWFDGTGVSLKMDAVVWEAARARLKEGQSVIGWYHSHPNLGAFFSGTDRRTQRDFFAHPHSLGLVADPVRCEEKWFIGPDAVELTSHQILGLDEAL